MGDNENTDVEIKDIKDKMMAIRLSQEEFEMVKTLKSNPHWINVAEYLRDTIRHLYASKINKAGRVK